MDLATGAWQLPEELRALQELVADFVAKEVRPVEERLEFDDASLAADDLAKLEQKARQANLWMMASPSEYGGAGLSMLAQVVVAEEASQCKLGVYLPAAGAFGMDPPNVIYSGTSEQIQRHAVRSIETGEKSYIAISEPSGGSDPARSIQTRAVRDGDSWILNGTKTWVTAADEAAWGVVFARTGRADDRAGISCFVVDRSAPGITMRPIPVMRAWSPSEVTFQDCRIPLDHLLGDEGAGFSLADKWLVKARLPYAASGLGVARAALRLAIDYSKERHVFGTALSDKQAIQWMLADSEIEIRAARLMLYQAAWRADLGQDYKVDASAAKVFATEVAGRVVDRCIQIFGGLGVSRELPLERWYRELRVKRIGEGPSEVHRLVVARSLLGTR